MLIWPEICQFGAHAHVHTAGMPKLNLVSEQSYVHSYKSAN